MMLNALRKSFEPAKGLKAPLESTPAEQADGNALFEALVCELHWTALQIGAVASSMNACLAFKQSWMLRSCSNLLPVESPIVRLALRSWRDISLTAKSGSAIHHIYLELLDAKTTALPLIRSAGNFTDPPISQIRLEQLAAVWRKLAEDCRDAILELEPETRWRLNGAYTGNALVLSKFLKEAAVGAYGCVDRQGEVALPVLPRRRRTRTYRISRRCKITSTGGVAVGNTIRCSTDGIDFNSDRTFEAKDSVVIELQNGRQFKGLVTCAKAYRTSMRFDQSLSEDDILLAAS